MKFIANISMCDASFYVPLAQAAEAAGFDTIAVPDSIAYPKESSSTYRSAGMAWTVRSGSPGSGTWRRSTSISQESIPSICKCWACAT